MSSLYGGLELTEITSLAIITPRNLTKLGVNRYTVILCHLLSRGTTIVTSCLLSWITKIFKGSTIKDKSLHLGVQFSFLKCRPRWNGRQNVTKQSCFPWKCAPCPKQMDKYRVTGIDTRIKAKYYNTNKWLPAGQICEIIVHFLIKAWNLAHC